MNRLARKFIGVTALIFIVVMAIFLFLNNVFIERYYLYGKKKELTTIYEELKNNKTLPVDQMIDKLESENEVVIVRVESNGDNNYVNGKIREGFLDKGLGIEKFWLWDKDYESARANGRQMRIYNQGKLNYSLLVDHAVIGDDFFSIAMIIPKVSDMLKLINYFQVFIFLAALIIMITLVAILVKRITQPLSQLSRLTQEIAHSNFKTIDIRTGDEIETLAVSINSMSQSLKESQEALKLKNRQMEELLSNVSHDLKTPVALIKAYSTGIKDGLDDGTFLDTIVEQNHKIDCMLEQLLNLSRIAITEKVVEPINISSIANTIIKEQSICAHNVSIDIISDIDPDVWLNINEADITSVFMNFITNAIKYTADQNIHISLKSKEKVILFQISNGVAKDSDIRIERLWEPYYVGETSRSKELSGTGLGLAIVKALSDKYGFQCGCYQKEGTIYFYAEFTS